MIICSYVHYVFCAPLSWVCVSWPSQATSNVPDTRRPNGVVRLHEPPASNVEVLRGRGMRHATVVVEECVS